MTQLATIFPSAFGSKPSSPKGSKSVPVSPIKPNRKSRNSISRLRRQVGHCQRELIQRKFHKRCWENDFQNLNS